MNIPYLKSSSVRNGVNVHIILNSKYQLIEF